MVATTVVVIADTVVVISDTVVFIADTVVVVVVDRARCCDEDDFRSGVEAWR